MTILVGYTATPEGRGALRLGTRTAQLTGKPLAIFPLADPSDAQPDLAEALASGATLLAPDPASDYKAEELLDRAAEEHVSLVVIGVRNRSRVSKILLGSDAQRIILGSPVPVLTVKAGSDES